MTASGSFRRWERFMFVFVVANFLVIPLVVFSHPHLGPGRPRAGDPRRAGRGDSTAILLIIAIVGTTVAPWQLFFQQSNIVDKRITPRWINYERADTVIGSLVTVFAARLSSPRGLRIRGHAASGHFTNAASVAEGLEHYLGSAPDPVRDRSAERLDHRRRRGDAIHVVRLRRRLLGVSTRFTADGATPRASTAPLDARVGRRRGRAHPPAPLGLITTAVQALAGVLLPSATVFLVLLCNDKEVLGPWVNGLWLNILAGLIVSVSVRASRSC